MYKQLPGGLISRDFSERDCKSIPGLVQKIWGISTPEDYWFWKYIKTPFPTKGFVVENEDGELIAFTGCWQRPVRCKGRDISAVTTLDVMADPKYRGGAAYKTILNRVATEIAGKFQFYGFPNDVSHRIYRRLFRKIIVIDEKVSVLISPIDASSYVTGNRFFKRIAGGISLGLQALRLSVCTEGSVKVSRSLDVTDDFDELWSRAKDEYGWIQHRGKDFLHWRYMMDPTRNYQLWKAVKEGALVGYMVTTIKQEGDHNRGLVMDWLTSPKCRDVLNALLASVMRWFVKQRVDMVEAWLPEHDEQSRKIMKSFFFMDANNPMRFLLAKGEKDEPLRYENLFLTMGDAD